jgi:exonuclease VII small subunit
MTDDEWVEQFYEMLESGLDNYKRPADYKERAKRILEGNRNTVNNQREGAAKWNSND